MKLSRGRIYVNIQIDEGKAPLSAASGQTGFIAFRPSSRNRPCPNRRTLLNSRRRFCCKSKTPQTPVRVLGRSVEQPSPEYCSRRNIDSRGNWGNGTHVLAAGTHGAV